MPIALLLIQQFVVNKNDSYTIYTYIPGYLFIYVRDNIWFTNAGEKAGGCMSILNWLVPDLNKT